MATNPHQVLSLLVNDLEPHQVVVVEPPERCYGVAKDPPLTTVVCPQHGPRQVAPEDVEEGAVPPDFYQGWKGNNINIKKDL